MPFVRIFRISRSFSAVLLSLPVTAAALAADAPQTLVHLTLDERSGSSAADSSGNGLNAEIVGGANWADGLFGNAVSLDGRSRLRIPDTARLSLSNAMTLSLWIRGSALPYRVETGQENVRAPYFQVVGERIFLATNADFWPQGVAGRDFKNADWPLLVGQADIGLSPWTYERKTERPTWGLEPKLQVVGDKVHLEYFGGDQDRNAQIYTAQSDTSFGNWSIAQHTQVKEHSYGVEQAGNIQVVGNRLYTGYPRKDSNKVWQLVTLSCALDGSDRRETPRTSGPDGGWIPTTQVWNDRIYYLYPTLPEATKDLGKPHSFDLYFARSDLDGGNWTVLRKVGNASYMAGGWGHFQISDGVVYLQYQQQIDDKTWHSAVYTATMNVDGTDLKPVRRTFDRGFFGASHNSVQVVGDTVYYVYSGIKTRRTASQLAADRKSTAYEGSLDPKNYQRQYWTATAKRDGSSWRPQLRAQSMGGNDSTPGYRALQVVGAKTYFSQHRYAYDAPRPRRIDEALAVAGANLISKGDAFGIGLTEDRSVRAFLNAGADYLFRGEAPLSVSGAIVDAPIDAGWHQVTMSYDGATLSLYIDGERAGTTRYAQRAAVNPFPLLIGDGFRGVVDELQIWNQALSAEAIRVNYAAARARIRDKS